jgi:hypothetical protein
MGCIARLGCLVLLVILGVAAWFTRGWWLPRVTRQPPPATATWEPLTDDGVERTRAALSQLEAPSGPVFRSLSGGDVASYVFDSLARQLPRSTDSVQAGVFSDQLRLRAVIRPGDLGDAGMLGAVGAILRERERVELAGTLRVVGPGIAEFDVSSARVGSISVPQAAVPRLLRGVFRGERPPGMSPRGVPLRIPSYVGDVRIADGRITLYRTTR